MCRSSVPSGSGACDCQAVRDQPIERIQLATVLRSHYERGRLATLNPAKSGKPVATGHDVWFGGGCIVCPGVTIGEESVIGAGASRRVFSRQATRAG